MLQPLDDTPATGSGPADPDAVKDFWLSCAKPADAHGALEKLPTVKGVSPRGRDIARKQNYALTRKVYGMPEGYERIKWNHAQPELVDSAFIDQWFEEFANARGD